LQKNNYLSDDEISGGEIKSGRQEFPTRK
jgi:hypothetical protein